MLPLASRMLFPVIARFFGLFAVQRAVLTFALVMSLHGASGQSNERVSEEIADPASVRDLAVQSDAERRQALEDFQAVMGVDGTVEQKQAAADSLRAAMNDWLEGETPSVEADPLVVIADLKGRAAGDAAKLSFFVRVEEQMEDQQAQGRKIDLINQTAGEQKQQLLDEFREDWVVALEKERNEQGETDPSGPLPPERASNLVQSEQRLQDYQQMLAQAEAASSPEKAEIFEQWRERMEAELSVENAPSEANPSKGNLPNDNSLP